MDKLRFLVVSIVELLGRFFVSKQSGFVFFGCQNARVFNGNIEVLFKSIYKDENLRGGFCLSIKDKVLYEKLNLQYPHHIVYAYSLRAFVNFLKANWVVISHGDFDVYPFTLMFSRASILNVWHGIPIKKVGGESWLFGKINAFVCSGFEEKELLKKAFGLDESQMIMSGMPRLEVLTELSETRFSKSVLYAPTFRDGGSVTELFPFEDFNKIELNEFLKENNILINIRMHINEGCFYQKKGVDFGENVIFTNLQQIPDVQVQLANADLLMTDYSGIYFDYLVLEKPIAFIPYDFDEYYSSRGFLYDYDEITPGPKIGSQKELIEYFTETLVHEKNSYTDELVKLKEKVYQYEGRATETLKELLFESSFNKID